MKFKSTIILLVLVLIAGAVWLHIRKKPSTEEQTKARKYVINIAGKKLEVDAVSAVEIQSEKETFVVRRSSKDKKKWNIEKPRSLRADRWEVESIIRDIAGAKRSKTIPLDKENETDLKAMGLAEPRALIKLTPSLKGAQPVTIQIGSETGVDDTVNLRIEGMPFAYVADKNIANGLKKTLNDLRSKELIDVDADGLDGLEISVRGDGDAEAAGVKCTRGGESWRLDHPVKDLADAQAVRGLVDAVKRINISAGDFVSAESEKMKEYGLDKPRVSVAFIKQGKAQTVLVGDKVKENESMIYVARKEEPTVAKVRAGLLDDLKKTPQDIRLRKLVSFDKDKVKNVKVACGADRLDIRKTDAEKWKITTKPAEPADGEAVRNLLDFLKDAAVADFVDDEGKDPGKYGLGEKDALDVSLLGEDGKTLSRFMVGGRKDGDVYARRSEFPCVYTIKSADSLEDLMLGRIGFVSRTLLEFEKDKAKMLSLVRPDGKSFEFESVKGKWLLVKPVSAQTDEWAFNSVLYSLSSLRARRIVALAPKDKKNLAKYGLDKPEYKVNLTYTRDTEQEKGAVPVKKTEEVSRMLLVGGTAGKAEDSGRYAMLADGKYVFVMSGQDVDSLAADLVTRRICKLDEKELTNVKFVSGKTEFSFDRKDEKWVPADDLAVKVGIKKLEDALALLRNFDGEKIADYYKTDMKKYGLFNPALKVIVKQQRITTAKELVIGSPIKEKDEVKGFYVTGPDSNFILVASKRDVEKLMELVKAATTAKKEEQGRTGAGASGRPAVKKDDSVTKQNETASVEQDKREPGKGD